jgi:hypothetical protein
MDTVEVYPTTSSHFVAFAEIPVSERDDVEVAVA